MDKRKIGSITTIIFLWSLLFACVPAVYAEEADSYAATVYDTDGGGLVMRESPDMKSRKYTIIPEDTEIFIDRISGAWGHTAYNGYTGWVSLMFTKIAGPCEAQRPEELNDEPLYYMVGDTDGQGLELRLKPTSDSSTFGPLEDGTVVMTEAWQQGWIFTSFDGNYGWLSLEYLEETEAPREKQNSTCEVTVYNTQNAGLALKAEADLASERYLYIPEGTVLTIDKITDDGWGHTNYLGTEGWISMQFTCIDGMYMPQIPTYGKITPEYYEVRGTGEKGLEYRIRPSVGSSSYGSVEEKTVLLVYAIEEDWGYAYYDGHFGWLNMNYLEEK